MTTDLALDALAVCLIDGQLVTAGSTYANIAPATGETVGLAAAATAAMMDEAIAAARRAFDRTDWSRNLELRVRCLRQLHAALVAQAPTMRDITTLEVGAPVFLTNGPQYDLPVDDIAWVADLAERYDGWSTDLGVATPMGVPSHRWMEREAAGVVAAVTPWNFPHQINLAKLAPALAAGCTVVLKAAPETPWCASSLARIIAEDTDIPPGVVNIVTSDDHALGAQLVADPRVDLVSFTGSTATGKAVMAAAADNLTRVFLELGGKSAFIVLDDADVASAATLAAFAACTHAGQGCALTTRLVVPRLLYDSVVDVAAQTMDAIGVGDPTTPGTVCGPVISERQRDRIEGYLRLAVEEGGSFACGGGRPADRDTGYWIEPTLIVGLDNTARVAREEIFGPVLTVIAHDGDDHAVAIANDSPYGLSGAVYSADIERATAVGRRVRTGTMGINGGVWYGGSVPFGGMKQSGIGREMGVLGFEEYTEARVFAEPAS